MKTIKHFSFAIVLALTTILTSCSNSDNGGGGGSASLGTLKASVGGVNFTSFPQATFAVIASNGAFQNLTVSGSDITGKSLSLTIITANITAGTTYQITDQGNEIGSCTYSEMDLANPTTAQVWAAPYDGGGNSGSITVSSKTATNIQGTFTVNAKNTADNNMKAITNGSFNINLSAGN